MGSPRKRKATIGVDAEADLRREQRELGSYVESHRKVIANASSNEADSVLKKLNVQFSKVTKAREGRIDADAFAKVSALTVKQAYTIGKANQKVTAKALVDKLRDRHSNGSRFDWGGLGRDVGCFFRGVPQLGFMHGPLDDVEVAAPEKKKKIKRAVKEVHALERPETVEEGDVTAADAKDQNKRTQDSIQIALEKQTKRRENATGKEIVQPVGAFNFLVNPKSFSQTVENVFHFSFLVKDGWAGMGVDEDGLPVVRPTDPALTSSTTAKRDRQAVLAFSMADWERVKGAFDIDEGMVPARTGGDGVAEGSPIKSPRAQKRRKSSGKGKGKARARVP